MVSRSGRRTGVSSGTGTARPGQQQSRRIRARLRQPKASLGGKTPAAGWPGPTGRTASPRSKVDSPRTAGCRTARTTTAHMRTIKNSEEEIANWLVDRRCRTGHRRSSSLPCLPSGRSPVATPAPRVVGRLGNPRRISVHRRLLQALIRVRLTRPTAGSMEVRFPTPCSVSPWGAPQVDTRVPFGSDVLSQDVVVESDYDGNGSLWVAQVLVC